MDDDEETRRGDLHAYLEWARLAQMRNDERLRKISEWIDTWQQIRSFGMSLRPIGDWVFRVCVSAWLATEAWHRWFGK